MATASLRPKASAKSLLDKFENLIEERSAEMTDAEFKKAEQKFNEVVEKVKARVSHRGNRERA